MKWNDPARANGRLRAHDVFTLAYLGVGLLLILMFAGRLPNPLTLGAWHLGGMAAIVLARKARIERNVIGALVMDFYPVVLFSYPPLEVRVLHRMLTPEGCHDDRVREWDDAVCGGQRSQTLHQEWPIRWLGEYLHLSYFLYYIIVPIMAFTVRFTRSVEDYERAIATVAASFYLSFLCFIVLPVTGPYHVFTVDSPEKYGYLMPKVVRWVLDRGSSMGTAFPSSHVSVSVATWIVALRFAKPVAVLYLFIVPTLALGAIYGGYHYAIDTVAGAVLGVLAGTVGLMLATRVGKRAWS